MIDTGHKRDRSKLISNLQKLGVAHLDVLVLTHTHFDHAGNAGFIKEKFNANVFVHSSEKKFLEMGKSPLPDGTIFPLKFFMSHFKYLIQKYFDYPKCQSDVDVGEKIDFSAMGIHACILHCPGHSRGSVALIVDDEIALVGDAMFGIFPPSIFPPFGDNVEQMLQSWQKLNETGCVLFLPGHGSPISQRRLKDNILAKSKK